MISRHIPIEPENDNYGRLARYIARIGEYAEDKEKPSLVWCAGCVGGDDYAEGIAEVQDVQALNTRVASNKSYHLVVSFRPEDMTRSVDAKGAVVFTLPGGGKVRDTGKEVLFSGSDELAVKVAQFYARKKWGQRVRMDKGSIVFDVEAEKIQERPRKCLSR